MADKDLQTDPKPVRDSKGRWVEGNAGGPGNKRTVSILPIVRRILREYPEKAEAIAWNLVEQAADNKPTSLGFIREILDRLDGPVAKELAMKFPEVREGIKLEDRPTRGSHDPSRN